MRTTRFPPWRATVAALVTCLFASGANAGPMRTEGAPLPWLQPTSRPTTLAELKARLDESDRHAALQALDFALSELSDGAAYFWGRSNRSLTGMVMPTMAFRDGQGRVCRHVIYMLALGSYSKSIEGIACRRPDGVWSLSG
jgi:hypothetical protein